MKTTWEVQETASGWDILKNRRAFDYDLSDLAEAISRIKRSRFSNKGDEIKIVEITGHKTFSRL